ncbi:unnamed protein product [Strongylus vulgaris]|uniref:Uncharacterized protein n=1 Tax=Strongylus vulgaris TaxID=40348 RepID=A0A3P7JCB2_STRVU|nr:unnamed protein product [Strongylus vulgaris]
MFDRKSHRVLLDYLGIGLTETLWHYISALPLLNVQITVAEVKQAPQPTNKDVNMLVPSAPRTPPSRQSSTPRSEARKGERSAPAQNSSEIVDPRIANEIRALREREDELRRSRTELGLPTLDDVMSRYDQR